MTSTQISEQIQKFVGEADDNSELMKMLLDFARPANEIIASAFATVPLDGQEAVNANARTRNLVSNQIKAFLKHKPSTVNTLLNKLEEATRRLYLQMPHSGERTTSYHDVIEGFRSKYDDFLSTHSFPAALELLRISQVLKSTISADRDTLGIVRESLAGDTKAPEGVTPIRFTFKMYMSLDEIADRLISLQRLYEELCRSLDQGLAPMPLSVVKVETGSLEIVVAGWPAAILLMSYLVIETGKYVYRINSRATRTRSWMDEQYQAEVVQVAIVNQLKASGLDTTAAEQIAAKTSEQIGKNLYNFVRGDAFTINGQAIDSGYSASELTESLVGRKQNRLPEPRET